jgi:hypothetical protein
MSKLIQAICVLLLLSILAGQVFVQNAKTGKILLVETGEGFHGDEVKARNGEKWLGLYVTKRGAFLAESTLTVRRVVDPVIDEDERKPTGKSVSVDRREKPVFLVKNAVMLKQGQATTIYHGGREEPSSLTSKSLVTLKLGGQTYQLKVVSPKRLLPEAEGLLPADAKLTLTSGSSTQTLYSLNNSSEDASWRLLWAGDLDGDGKLDLYLSVDGYNFEERWLFLSSQAGPGQLVKGVAKFTTTGC